MPSDDASRPYPPGLRLRHMLHGHTQRIGRISWSPDGRFIASPLMDGRVRLWDAEQGVEHIVLRGSRFALTTARWSPDDGKLAVGVGDGGVVIWDFVSGQPMRVLLGHQVWVTDVAWSPDGKFLAASANDQFIAIWHAETGKLKERVHAHEGWGTALAWSPDGARLASASSGGLVQLHHTGQWKADKPLRGHSRRVISLAWSPDGTLLASSSEDRTVRIWDAQSGQAVITLEAHKAEVRSVSFSADGLLLASKSHDNTVKLWRCDTWQVVADLAEKAGGFSPASLAFHPHAPVLATLGDEDRAVRVWDLEVVTLLNSEPPLATSHYVNAKVVLLGDSSVGKSGLGLVLCGMPFGPTESTHGRHVRTFESREFETEGGVRETREVLLWDLAGQPGYRLIHQLHLKEVAVALVLFDARSETDPFAGVRHWERALRQALAVQGNAAPPLKKFLVAARADRGGVGASRERVEAFVREFGFDGFFETSAKEGWQIVELAEAVRGAIEWPRLPKVSSTGLFESMKRFVVEEKKAGRLLSTTDDLYRAFLHSEDAPAESEELRGQFETSVGRLESRDLVRRLSFGGLVLLQPEMLDAYASAIVNAARQEPDGLGFIAEEDVRAGRFQMPSDERIREREQESLLLIATVEDLIRHQLALREPSEGGPLLVFPSQLTRVNPDLPDPEGQTVTFAFEGPLLNVYATLAVRLSRSGMFKRKEMWKNAAVYTAEVGGACGVLLRELDEGRGELTLFFDPRASAETAVHFEEFVYRHLQRRALPDSIKIRRTVVCQSCRTPVTELAASRRRERGFDWITCGVCEERVSLLDARERLTAEPSAVVREMNDAADAGLAAETAVSVLQGKIKTGDFDVFLCHNVADKPAVRDIGGRLKRRGILPWLDEEQLRPGLRWQDELEKQVEKIK
ncbi:MAG TPA: TIR domain-containing protein, partial [Pyrinomonadaceae bacterium]|nr:TIR domain-containing protein [Pyrinomonadaceae bacterium]